MVKDREKVDMAWAGRTLGRGSQRVNEYNRLQKMIDAFIQEREQERVRSTMSPPFFILLMSSVSRFQYRNRQWRERQRSEAKQRNVALRSTSQPRALRKEGVE